MRCDALNSGVSPQQSESDASDPGTAPRGIPGRWVILAIFVVSILGSTLGVYLIRPVPGAAPADIEDRPFGPASRSDQNKTPLIYRSGDGR